MKGYKCSLQIDKLNQKREEFWNLRNSHGAPNYKTWRIINQACVYDEYRANVLMEEYNLTTYEGCINHIVDKNGIHYIIPNYCINDPYFEKEYKIDENIQKINLKLNLYEVATNTTTTVETTNLVSGLELKQMLEKKYLYGLNKFIKLPIIFNITLLRSLIDKPLIETKVIINEEVNLKDFLDSDFGTYLLPTIYKIYALNICKGHSKSWGHYYSYIIINNEWYKFDDLNVSKVEKSDIEEDLSYIYGVYYINKEYFDSFKDK